MNPDPAFHESLERQFIDHVQRLLSDDRLRLDTTRGTRPVTLFKSKVESADKAVDLKRLMSQAGKPDRDLESHMPKGRRVTAVFTGKRWGIFPVTVGRLLAVCVSPLQAILADQPLQPLNRAQVAEVIKEVGSAKFPTTVAILSTSGFTPEARDLAQRSADRTVILISPNSAGGWTVAGPPEIGAIPELFDPEPDAQKRARLQAEFAAHQADLEDGLAADKLAARLQLPTQFVELELKSHARANPGLVAKRLDGRVVLFREGSALLNRAGGSDMPFIDKLKTLFARKGDVDKKIAFLSERRAALSQQRDGGYEEIGVLETREGDLRKQFADAGSDLTRRRITSQLVQLHKDIERRQQLLGVLNQQVNVVNTHLHNLELQHQGKAAKLPDSEELATAASAAEEVLAELQASSEVADSVTSGSVAAGMSDEEQALYDELMGEQKTPAPDSAALEKPAAAPQSTPAAVSKPPVRTDPEPG